MATESPKDHERYRIAFRIHTMIQLMEKRSYTMIELAAELGVTRKTALRMKSALESMGIPFYNESHGKWKILK